MRLHSLFLIATLGCSLCGCGGGGSSSNSVTRAGTGSATFTIHWPASHSNSRLIPAATQSIKISLLSGSTLLTSQTLSTSGNETTSTANFTNLTPGTLGVQVSAFSTTDATGTALATGSASVTIISGQVTSASLTLASTINHITLNYTGTDLLQNQTAAVTATAYDAAGDIVLLTPSALSWQSSDATKVSVASTASGATLTGVGAGAATITVTDTESGVSQSVSVSGMTFSLSSAAVALPVNGSYTFTAVVAGLSDTSVTFSLVDSQGNAVASGGSSGSLTAQGVYTAPSAPGTFYVRVTSNGDPSRWLTATLIVQAGNGAITVQ